jgi:hypothetical protein
MKRMLLLVASLAGLVVSSPAWADSRDFNLTNATGYAIKAVYMDTTASRVWGYPSEIDTPLQNGETVRIAFGRSDGKACMWDLRVTWVDGSPDDIWTGINVCTVSNIKLFYDRATDVTTAEMD